MVMKTQRERIKQLHIRAAEIKRQNEKRKTAGLGGFCIGLFVMLLVCMIRVDDSLQNIISVDVQGSSLLSDSAGGYILAAVLAFFSGVIITVVIFRYRKK
jgi:hypothetical protein